MNTTTLTNETPAQTFNRIAGYGLIAVCTDEQAEAIGLLIQALDAESDAWAYSTDGLEDAPLPDTHPYLLVWRRGTEGDEDTLSAVVDEEGDCQITDASAWGHGPWHRVAGADVTGLLASAWSDDFSRT